MLLWVPVKGAEDVVAAAGDSRVSHLANDNKKTKQKEGSSQRGGRGVQFSRWRTRYQVIHRVPMDDRRSRIGATGSGRVRGGIFSSTLLRSIYIRP